MTRVSDATCFLISALDPTATMRSPAMATPSAQGRRTSPVHTRALTTASVGAPAGRDAGVMVRKIAYPQTSQPLRERFVISGRLVRARRATFLSDAPSH